LPCPATWLDGHRHPSFRGGQAIALPITELRSGVGEGRLEIDAGDENRLFLDIQPEGSLPVFAGRWHEMLEDEGDAPMDSRDGAAPGTTSAAPS